jgi:hypothetical protein
MKKISILFIALLGLFTASCDKDFTDVNTDPNKPTAVPADLLLGSLIRVNQNVIYNMQGGGDMGMCWAQHVSKVQYNNEERYIPRRAVIDGIWDALYASVISDAKSMYTLAEAEGNTNLQAVSLIMQANAFQILTDVFGPIPFSQACQPGVLKPAYDSQEVVYAGISDMLDQAEDLLANGSGEISSSSDLIYGGDASKWRKFGNALHLKVLMRISKAPGVNNAAQISDLVAAGNMMTSNADSAQLVYLSAQPDANPIYETIVYGVRAEYKVSSVLVENLEALNDPRLPVYAQPNSGGEYVGNIPGEENSGNYNDFSALGTFYLQEVLPGVLMSYAQQEILLAEAYNEGYVAGGDITNALTHYNNAIVSNFEFNGVEGAAAYISQPDVTFASQIIAKGRIGMQNWLLLYGQGIEAWTEWRRTGYPELFPVVDAALPSIPARYFYPTTEVSLNNANYSAAVGTLPGGDQLTSPVWWEE